MRWIAFSAGAALLMAGAWLVSKWAGTPPQLTFEALTFRRGVVWSARFTPDGQSVVYGAAWDGKPVELFETRVGGTESRALGFEPGNILAISRAGEMAIALRPSFIRTFKHLGTLARASLAGGAARELLADVNAADWSPDGKELAAAHESNGKFLLEFPPGKAILESEGILGDLRFSPDGSRIAFWEYAHSRARVVVVSSDGSGRRVLSDGWQVYSVGLAWAPDGREIWFTAARDLRERSAIYAVDLSAQVRVVSRMPGSLELFDVARDGRVLMSHAVEGPGVVVHAPGAAAERDLSWLGLSFLGDLSWDGRTVVFTEAGVLYLRKTDGSAAVRLGNGFGLGAVALSPDGAWVAAAMTGSPARLALVPTGAGASRELALKGLEAVNSVLWTHDSKTIFFLGWQDGHGVRIYRQDLSEENPRSITTDILGADGLVLSPDGHSLASLSEGSLRLFSIEGTALQVVPGNFSGHTLIGWASDGRALYSYRITDLPGRIYRLDVATGALQVFREMLPADPAGIWRIHPVRITPDGSSYAYTYSRRLGDLYVFDGLK